MTLYKGFIRNAGQTPLDVRLATAAQLTRNTDGSIRTGILATTLPSLVTARGDLAVAVGDADFVSSKSIADGAVIFGNRGAVAVALEAAPTANSRIDVVYAKHNDDTTGDGNPLPTFGVVKGDAAASPVKKPVPTGAVELATVLLPANVTATNAAGVIITQTAQGAALIGSPVPFRTATELGGWTTAPNGTQAWVALPSTAQANTYLRRGNGWAPQSNDTGRIPLTLGGTATTGWSASSTTGTPAYSSVNGWTSFQGRVDRAGGTARIATIPGPFAPPVLTIFTAGDSSGATRRVQIDTNGNVDLLDNVPNISGLSLADIGPFRAMAF